MKTYQKEITLNSYARGFHIIDAEIETSIPEMKNISKGILHIFIKHTSASIVINENADSSVRNDMENYFNKIVPENESYFTHTHEGTDDMPAHIKSSMLGSGVTIPVSGGKLNIGTWQGIYLCEHRNRAQSRKIILTLIGS